MIQNLTLDIQSTAPTEPARRETEGRRFNAALELQTATLLSAMLDPGATASLPGAGAALAQAEAASLDVTQAAAERLSRQESRESVRERGLDAATQARRELAERGPGGQQSAEASDAPVAPSSRDGLKEAASERASADAAPRAEEPGSASRVTPTGAASGQSQNQGQGTGRERAEPSGVAPEAAQAGAAGASAVSTSRAGAAAGTSGSAGAVSGVSQAASAGTVRGGPSVIAGAGSPAQKAQAESAGRAVIRHEPRTFEAQLQRGLAQVLRQQGGTLSMKLDPAELGTVRVSLRVSQGHVDGTIEAANESARGLLENHLDTLKSSLERRGITVDRLEVRLAGAAESERQFAARQDAEGGQDRQGAGAGGDRQSGSFRGEDRQAGERGGTPVERTEEGLRGAGPRADEWHGQGRPAEPLGGWLRLDTLA